MSLMAAALDAAVAVRARPPGTRWLLSCDTDADGLCAGAVAFQALRRIGHRAIVRPSRDKTEAHYRSLFAEEVDGHILLDKGTSHLGALAEGARATGRPVVVLDHHNLVGETSGFTDASATEGRAQWDAGVHLVNPRAVGLDGSRDASAATTAVAFAIALVGDDALAWAPTGLSGAIGDWQHQGGWRGWNQELVERSRAAGHLRPVRLPRFIGVDLAEALTRFRPAIPGLSGDAAAARSFLQALSIEAGAETEDLDAEARTRLVSAVALRLLSAGERDAIPALVHEDLWNVRLGTSLRHVFRIVDSCGRERCPGTGIAYLLGDPAGKADALAAFARYKAALRDGVERLRTEGTRIRRALQAAWTERHDYTGMVAGLGMTVVVPDRVRPLCVLARRPEGNVQVSTRGTEDQEKAGLDLGEACRKAAAAVGSEGGGHPVAAGAVIAAEKVETFLQALDDALVEQGFLGKVAP